ncbi:hypothetical protein WQ54_19395 [Bacillus sp. SA1-12]|uniref:hypothetical protein n=1 Tax=Bacillus sp. SA1-12 TaxID=1455638 RepID=UPI0006271D03|nr:hypothetical protein [Bacillus sp. SA1-12]KKI90686.1 hypothetical protein WQ54_19395 [Bacillus sp. SA1-12]
MKEVKRSAKVGEKIKITREHQRLRGHTAYPLGSIWVVEDVLDEEKGLVFCYGNSCGKFAEEYVVLEE